MNPTPYQFAQTVEEASLNAWPALQTMLLDGWLLRFANGYSRRNNSVNALFAGREPLPEKFVRCEAIFRRQGQPPTFRMTPFSQPDDLDAALAARGYAKISPTSVQGAPLAQLPPPNPAIAVRRQFAPDDPWVAAYSQMNLVRAGKEETLRQILDHIPVAGCYASIEQNGEMVACGLGVLQEQFVGLFDIVTHPAQRGRGLGKAIVLDLLHWAAENGAAHAYLQVVADNAPALRLYAGLGFTELYQYWYRVED
ncbi:MAG: GNAT family N-acetyltransferase [Anaerolineae bacterium]